MSGDCEMYDRWGFVVGLSERNSVHYSWQQRANEEYHNTTVVQRKEERAVVRDDA